jgi:hypothetical protein
MSLLQFCILQQHSNMLFTEEQQKLLERIEILERRIQDYQTQQSNTLNEKKQNKPTVKHMTGYILYCKTMREDAIQTLLEDNTEEKPKPSDVLKKLASMWREASDNIKALYNTEAKHYYDSEEQND